MFRDKHIYHYDYDLLDERLFPDFSAHTVFERFINLGESSDFFDMNAFKAPVF